ncbi:MAG TPA: hypothetical protein PLE74_06520 [Candidatus Cloacimonadota bacterium]|nr:hypothetical protein [Candidatus Cloacimonadota bacterium]HPT71917.1 hypothetical protein [Candidatus Cloacimonadota bacterium]
MTKVVSRTFPSISNVLPIHFLSHSNPERLERDWYGIGIPLARDWNAYVNSTAAAILSYHFRH